MGSTPARNIRVTDEVWDAARARARHERTNVTAVVVGFLRAYASGPAHHPPVREAPLESHRSSPWADPAHDVAGDVRAAMRAAEAEPLQPFTPSLPEQFRANCPHPPVRVHKGLCGACGQGGLP